METKISQLEKNENHDVTASELYISPSALKTFITCPAKFKLDRHSRSIVSPDYLIMGRTVHKIMDLLTKWVIETYPNGLAENIKILKKKVVDDLITEATVEEGMTYKDHDINKCVEYVNTFIKVYPTLKEPFGRKAILCSERKFKCSIKNHKYRGIIDRVDDMDNGSIDVIDYKTGTVSTQDEVNGSFQGIIYKMYVDQEFKKQSRVVFQYVNAKKVIPMTPQWEYIFPIYFDACCDKIESVWAGNGPWKENLNPLCGWCQGIKNCETYNKYASRNSLIVNEINLMSGAGLELAYDKVRAFESKCKNIKEKLKEEIKTRLENNQGYFKYSKLSPVRSKFFDRKKLLEILKISITDDQFNILYPFITISDDLLLGASIFDEYYASGGVTKMIKNKTLRVKIPVKDKLIDTGGERINETKEMQRLGDSGGKIEAEGTEGTRKI